MAEAFLLRDNKVLICGRRQEKLDEACAKHPGLRAYRCDVSCSEERGRLLEALERDGCIPNVLINNAAMMRQYDLTDSARVDWEQVQQDIQTMLLAPAGLVHRFLPHLMNQSNSTIINVTSPLGVVPVAKFPFYSASKAALNSYTKSLHLQLQGKVEVITLFPPSVDTEMMDSVSIHKISVHEFIAELMTRLERGGEEIWIGEGRHIRWMNRLAPKSTHKLVNRSMKVD